LATLIFAAGASAQGLEKPKITMAIAGVKAQIDYLAFDVAEALGYFKDEGLEVDAPEVGSGVKAMQAVVGGSADVDAGSYEHTIQMQAKGQSIQCVALYRQAVGAAVGIGKGKIGSYKSPKDLKGMTIGVSSPGASSTAIFLNLVLAKAGLTPNDVSIIGVGNGSVAIAAIQSGKIDAISTVDPALTVMTRSGDLKIVVDGRTEAGTNEYYGSKYASGCMMMKTDFIKNNPKTTQAVVNATVRAILWIQSHSIDEIIKILPENVTGADKETFREALKNSFFTVAPDGLVSKQETETVLKTVRSIDPVVAKANIDLSKTYDNSFAEAALKKYRK
jgi:NitT/TauT family transport system substrate-binding protein